MTSPHQQQQEQSHSVSAGSTSYNIASYTWQHDTTHTSPRRRQSPRSELDSTMQRTTGLSSTESSSTTTPMGNRRRLSSALSDDSNSVKLTRTGRPSKALKGQAVHTCEDCGKVYTRAEHMRRHQRTHSQGLVCGVSGCERTFNRTDMLQRHKEKHHSSRPVSSRRHSASSRGSHCSISRSPVIPAHAQHPFSALPSPYVTPQSQSFEVQGMFPPSLAPTSTAGMPPTTAADAWDGLSLSSLPAAMGATSLPYLTGSHAQVTTSEPYPGGYSYSINGSTTTTDSWYSPGLSSIASPSLNSSSMPSAWGSTTSLPGPSTWDRPVAATPFGTLDPAFDTLPAPIHHSNPQGTRQRDLDLFTMDGNGGRESRFRKSGPSLLHGAPVSRSDRNSSS